MGGGALAATWPLGQPDQPSAHVTGGCSALESCKSANASVLPPPPQGRHLFTPHPPQPSGPPANQQGAQGAAAGPGVCSARTRTQPPPRRGPPPQRARRRGHPALSAPTPSPPPLPREHPHLPIQVLLQANGTVGGGAAAEGVQSSAAALAVALQLGCELSGLHLLQGLHCQAVQGILPWGGGREAFLTGGGGARL